MHDSMRRHPARPLLLFAAPLFAAGALGESGKLAPGQASGTFSVESKNAKISHATAFIDQQDSGKPVILILSDKEISPAGWKSGSDFSMYRREHPFLGVAIWLDKKNQVFRTEFYDGTSFPTSATGIFEVKLDGTGKSLTGSAHSTAAAAKLRSPVKLDVTFHAPVK